MKLPKGFAFLSILLIFTFLISGSFNVVEAESQTVKICYNGPPDAKENAVHAFASNFKDYLETRTDGEIKVELYSDSQLGDENQRMTMVEKGTLKFNIASFAGVSPIMPEIFASNIPFMFDDFQAAHIFFDESDFWADLTDLFEEKSEAKLLEPVEEGGFLAFTNSKREIKEPSDFEGLKFRAMDESQVALYEAFGASGTPIDWSELYTALQTGVVDGQMNPPMYINMGSLYEVQDYMTTANVQYSMQFLMVNQEWFNNLPQEHQFAVKKAAQDANVVNRVEVETMVKERTQKIKNEGVEVYNPTMEEISKFREKGQPAYIDWLKKKIDSKWIDQALEDAEWANKESERRDKINE